MPVFCIPAITKNVFTMLHWSQKTLSSSFKLYNLKIYVIKNSKKNSTYSYTNIKSHPTVEVLKKDFLHNPFLVSMKVVFEYFWRNIVKEL
jgi:hypothetical protein